MFSKIDKLELLKIDVLDYIRFKISFKNLIELILYISDNGIC